jgi:hypothetical protein
LGKEVHGDKTVKFGKFQYTFSESTGDADIDVTRTHFLDLTQQLRDALKNGDTETAQLLKKQLENLKTSFLNMRNLGF